MGEIKIPIAEEAYKVLLIQKKETESFSDVILRISKKNQGVEEVVGTQILSRADLEEVKRELKRASNLTFKKLDKK